MRIYKGKQIHKKIGIGPLYIYTKNIVNKPSELRITDRAGEIARFNTAIELTDKELTKIYKQAVSNVGRKNAGIIDAQRMLLSDENYIADIKEIILSASLCAEFAVSETSQKYVDFFLNAPNGELKARATDIKDVSERIIGNLLGKKINLLIDKPSIIFSDDLSAAELVTVPKGKIRGIVTKKGSLNSHTAIIARTLDIPMMVLDSEKADELKNYELAILDGEEGILFVDPDEATYEDYKSRIKAQRDTNESLNEFINVSPIDSKGRSVGILANITGPMDVDSCVKFNADGIGLFRTEFLYMGREKAPEEEELYKAYLKVVKKMGDRPVNIRALDIGSDKKVDYFDFHEEENPALGLRGIRFCLTHTDVFKTQLSAIMRVAAIGNVSVTLPMIISAEEVVAAKSIMEEVKESLLERKKDFKIPKLGVMIETPAAVFEAEKIAELADFLCIGTNDLTQYTLAIDRQNGNLLDFLNPYHSAILKMLESVVRDGHNAGIPVSICGEMALDKNLLERFLELKVDTLSVAPPNILMIRKNICAL